MFIILFLWALGRITSQGNYGVIGCLDEPQSLAETADSPVARSLAHQLEQATKLAVPASHKPGSASISRQQLPVCLQGVVARHNY